MQKSSDQNTTLPHDEIARIAQSLWQKAGQPQDRDLDFWLKAEEQIKTARTPISKAGGQRPKASTSEVLASMGATQSRREVKQS